MMYYAIFGFFAGFILGMLVKLNLDREEVLRLRKKLSELESYTCC